MRSNRAALRLVSSSVAAMLLALTAAQPAAAKHGDIHASCQGNKPVVESRPPGTEHVTVVCEGGLPEFVVMPAPMPTYDPVTQAVPLATPPDFGGWVTVWLNGRPLKTPYDPGRGLQEPGAWISASTGRVMMPVRFFTAAFGGTVEWSNPERRARLLLKNRVLSLWIGEPTATVNTHMVALDQPPVVFQDRMFLPVRFLMEAFGATVTWDHANRSAEVEMEGAACVHPVYCGEAR